MEYHIVSNGSIYEIQATVEHLMKDGWVTSGGLSSTSDINKRIYPGSESVTFDVVEHTFYQAMTRTCKPSKTVKKSGLQPKAVIDLWNEVTKDSPLPRKLKVLPALEQSIRTRTNEKDGFDTIEAWRSYFTAITRSNFLTGKNDRGWKADLEWAVKPKSIAGVIEGKYHNG